MSYSASDLMGDIKIDPSKTVYVIMANDRTHVFPDPGDKSKPWWTYNIREVDVVMMSLKKDFKNKRYQRVTLAQAVGLIGSKQVELMTVWKPVFEDIRKLTKLEDKFDLYAKAKRKLGAHPILLDQQLRQQLKIQ